MLSKLEFESKSPFLPQLTIEVWRASLPIDLTHRLSEIILEEEPKVLASTKSHPDDPDTTWLTSRLWQYNLFDWDYPEIAELKNFVKNEYLNFIQLKNILPNPVYVQCWANVIRNHRTIFKHNHATAHSDIPPEYSYLSGNICIRAKGTKTYYQNPALQQQAIGVPNEAGMMILFPSYINHWVDENKHPNPRLSIAFDILPQSTINLCQNKTNFRLL